MTRLAVVIAAALAGILPASAQAAPTLTLARPCFSEFVPVGLNGAGFTPNGQVELEARWDNGRDAGRFTVVADADGRIAVLRGLPALETERAELTLTARDVGTQATATVVAVISYAGAFYRPWNTDGPARGRPGRVRILDVDGFIDAGEYLYVHYRLRGRTVRTIRLGRLTGPCGSLRRRFREFGFRPVPPGVYARALQHVAAVVGGGSLERLPQGRRAWLTVAAAGRSRHAAPADRRGRRRPRRAAGARRVPPRRRRRGRRQ